MEQDTVASSILEDVKIHVRFRLFALWSSLMFLYIYGDYFELYQPGKLREMLAGRTALGTASQGILLGMSVLMAVPSLMACLSLVLQARVNRWANILLGIAYSLIVVFAIVGAWRYYVFLGGLEIAVSFIIIYQAWTWPKRPSQHLK